MGSQVGVLAQADPQAVRGPVRALRDLVDKAEAGERGLLRLPMLERVTPVLNISAKALTGEVAAKLARRRHQLRWFGDRPAGYRERVGRRVGSASAPGQVSIARQLAG
jgi:hypothetical protein